MARRSDTAEFRRHQKVVAARDLPGVPAGTKGKVQLVNGLSWIRYWVAFEDGTEVGQLGNDDLSTPEDWEASARRRRKAERDAEMARRRDEILAGQH